MTKSFFLFRYRLKDLLFLMLGLAAMLACVYQENISVAMGSVYCFLSIVAIVLLTIFLARQCWLGLTNQTVVFRRPITYLLIATVLLTWTFSVIAIANVVIENYSSRAIWLLYASVPATIVAGWLIFRR